MNHRIDIIVRKHDTEGRFFWRITDTDDGGVITVVGSSYELDEQAAKFAVAAILAGYMVHGKA